MGIKSNPPRPAEVLPLLPVRETLRPTAGVTMVTALVSLFSNAPVRPYVAMTGETTLSGQVLPVGGIKEKVLAAKRSGVRAIRLPAENEPHAKEDIPAHLRAGMTFHFVKMVDELLERAFAPARLVRRAAAPAEAANPSGRPH